MLKVHVHVHETRFTGQNICSSHSSTKADPGNVWMHALASALRLHGCAFAMCVYVTGMYMYMNFTAQNVDAR